MEGGNLDIGLPKENVGNISECQRLFPTYIRYGYCYKLSIRWLSLELCKALYIVVGLSLTRTTSLLIPQWLLDETLKERNTYLIRSVRLRSL